MNTKGNELMEIDIKYSKDKKDRILVCYGDDPTELAKKFVERNNLKPKSIPIISKYIESTIQSFFEEMKKTEQKGGQIDKNSPNIEEKYSSIHQNPNEFEPSSNIPSTTRNQYDSSELKLTDLTTPISTLAGMNNELDNNLSSNNDESMRKFDNKINEDQPDNLMLPENAIVSKNSSSPSSSKFSEEPESKQRQKNPSISSINEHDFPFITDSSPSRNRSHNSSPIVNKRKNTIDPSSGKAHHSKSHDDSLTIGRSDNNHSRVHQEKGSHPGSINNDHEYSNTDEYGILERIKDPHSIDHKQFHDNFDRNLNISSFSYHKIANEIVSSSKDPNTNDNTGLESRNRHKFHLDSRKLKADDDYYIQSTLSEIRSQSIGFYSSHNSSLNSTHPSSSNLPVQGPGPDHFFKPPQEQQEDMTTTFISPQNLSVADNGEQVPLKSHQPAQETYWYELRDINDPNYSSNKGIDLEDSRSSSNSRKSHTQGSREQYLVEGTADDTLRDLDGSEDPEDQEELLYNRAKKIWKRGTERIRANSSWSATSSQSSQSKLLKPSSKSMGLGVSKSLDQQINHGSDFDIRNKSASERLYLTALYKKQQQALQEQKKQKALKDQFNAVQFKLNKKSREIVDSIKSKSSNGEHIGERLYSEGMREKKQKAKRSEEFKELVRPEEWSCVRCGVFNKTASSTALPFHHSSNQSKLIKKKAKVCSNCGWDQSDHPDFKPFNVGLSLHDNATEVLPSRKSTIQSEGESIHDYLYANAQHRSKILEFNKKFWEETNNQPSFQPSIPESSRQLLSKYVEISQDDDRDKDSASSSRSNSRGSRSNLISGREIASYFKASATQRLASTRYDHLLDQLDSIKQNIGNNPQSSSTCSSFSGGNQPNSHVNSKNKKNDSEEGTDQTAQAKTENQTKFIDRLVYEYKDRSKNIEKLQQKFYAYDEKTGKKLFHPSLPENPHGNIVEAAPSHTLDGVKVAIHDKILYKDEILKQRKKVAQEQAIESSIKELQKSQARPLESSESIIKQSNEAHIEALFKLMILLQHDTQATFLSPGQLIDTSNLEKTVKNPKAISLIQAGWETSTINLSEADVTRMSDDIKSIILSVKYLKLRSKNKEREKSQQSEGINPAQKDALVQENADDLSMDYKEFRDLVLRSIKSRSGLGKKYLFAPRKKPAEVLKMIQEEEKNYTYRPKVDRHSSELYQNRRRVVSPKSQLHSTTEEKSSLALPVELILLAEGERIKSKREAARQEKIIHESKELTFKPTMYPSKVKPKYRGVELLDASENEIGLDANPPLLTSTIHSAHSFSLGSLRNSPFSHRLTKSNLTSSELYSNQGDLVDQVSYGYSYSSGPSPQKYSSKSLNRTSQQTHKPNNYTFQDEEEDQPPPPPPLPSTLDPEIPHPPLPVKSYQRSNANSRTRKIAEPEPSSEFDALSKSNSSISTHASHNLSRASRNTKSSYLENYRSKDSKSISSSPYFPRQKKNTGQEDINSKRSPVHSKGFETSSKKTPIKSKNDLPLLPHELEQQPVPQFASRSRLSSESYRTLSTQSTVKKIK